MDQFQLILAEFDDVETIYNLEIDSFPMDEAATLDTLKYRMLNANQYFYKYINKQSNQIIGFVNGTCTIYSDIHHESMTSHDYNGQSLVIHSVTIDSNYRKLGHGYNMLRLYIQQVLDCNQSIQHVLLLSKQYLLPFYLNCGFQLIRKSSVQHGQDVWYEMGLKTIDYNSIDQLQVDAFVIDGLPFTGNPAAVIFQQKDEIWMQNIAMENNLAETSFIVPINNNNDSDATEYKLRWFTPTKEVELCGHATLAAAHAIYESKKPFVKPQQIIKFHTLYSGILEAQGHEDGSISLDFPMTDVIEVNARENELLYNNYQKLIKLAFKILTDEDILFIGTSKYDLLIEISRLSFMKLLDYSNDNYDYNAMIDIGGRGLILTCAGIKYFSSHPINKNDYNNPTSTTATTTSTRGESIVHDDIYHFFSRFFAPRYGINEDPVTGSAHCSLAPYWFKKYSALALHSKDQSHPIIEETTTIGIKENTTSIVNDTITTTNPTSSSSIPTSCLINSNSILIGKQASLRGGVIHVSIVNERVILTGKCMTTIKSKVLV